MRAPPPPTDSRPRKRVPSAVGGRCVLATAATWLADTAEGRLVFPVVFFGGGWLLAGVDAGPRQGPVSSGS
jgi:hypothetical protein